MPRPSRSPIVAAASAALAALALAACAPDQVTAPPRGAPAARPSATVAGLATGALLHDQLRASGRAGSVTYFTSTGAPGVLLAADFVVPDGASWPVSQVVLSGGADTPTLSFSIRADAGGKPGAALHSYTLGATQSVQQPGGPCCYSVDYLFTLPAPAVLAPGTYWLAVDLTAGGGAFRWQGRAPRVGGYMYYRQSAAEPWLAYTGWEEEGAFALYAAPAPQAQTVAITSTAPSPALVGGTYTVTAAATSGLDATVGAGPAGVCTASAGVVRFVGVGACTVTADQAGGAGYLAAPQATQVVPVDYGFEGFAAPVDNGGLLNAAKAGQAIPLKWRLTDADGAPVTTLTAATVTAAALACDLSGDATALEAYAPGGSGLQHLGDGYYQLNWKSPGEYARSCKTLRLDLGEGNGPRTALFRFTK
jgi:hypothetical protein